MINIVVGGSYSGKSTFIKKHFLPLGGVEGRLLGVPITSRGPLCVIGHYGGKARVVGVDRMGRDYEMVREKIQRFLDCFFNLDYLLIAMEGNALMDRSFMEPLKKSDWQVKLWLMNPPAKEIEKRLKENKCKYGRSAIAMTHKRAWSVWDEYRKVFLHEVVN